MAASSDFNYADILSLEKAKINRRGRENYLGSRELIIEYPRVSAAQKEECIEWLEDNRITLTNANINFKDLTGTYTCVSIEYSDNSSRLIQRFKKDSQLGGYPSTDGDLAQISSGSTVHKTYFWKVVDPDAYNLPSSPEVGVIYDKSAVDNGDGTYDVVITKRSVPSVISGPSTRETALYTETTTVSINNTQQTASSWAVGTIVEAQNTPQDNGLYRTVVTTRTAKQFVPDSNWTYTFTGQESTNGADPIDGNDAQNTHLFINQGYFNDYLAYANSPYLISANNVLKANVDKVMAVLTDGGGAYPSESINYASVSVNEFGLYDINITRRFVV